MNILNKATRHGFTLLELLLVVGIIAIVVSIIIVANNPTKQISDARNTQRRSDVNTIINAVYQYMIDNNGNPPAGITTISKEICITGKTACSAGVNLDALSGSYIINMPIDPSADKTGTGTNYFILIDGNNRIVIEAPNAELGLSISR